MRCVLDLDFAIGDFPDLVTHAFGYGFAILDSVIFVIWVWILGFCWFLDFRFPILGFLGFWFWNLGFLDFADFGISESVWLCLAWFCGSGVVFDFGVVLDLDFAFGFWGFWVFWLGFGWFWFW